MIDNPVIDDDKCSEEIYKYGESYDLRTDLTKQQANEFCEKLTNASEEYAYDWHYIAGRVHIKRLKKSLLVYQARCKMTKTLTQDDFRGSPDWVKSAAVNESGIAYGHEKTKSNLRVLFIGSGGVHIASGSNTIELGKGYDTTNWQNSAIDRE